MVTIRLVGEAGRRFGRKFQLAIKTPAEGLRALMLQIPGLREYLLESGDKGVAWKVITDYAQDGIDEEQLLWPISERLVLAPVPVGRGGVGKIVAGVALVTAAILFAPAGAFLGLGGGLAGGFLGVAGATVVGSIGLSMIFGGVAELLTPTPKMPNVPKIGGSSSTAGRSEVQQLNSFTFDKSNANTVQGDVVPVLYGERIIGALPVLSFGLELQNHL
jgi:predicted phage tail protein